MVTGTATGTPQLASLVKEASSLPWPAHLPLSGSEPGSFAEGTITKRLPAILASTIGDLDKVAARADTDTSTQIRALITDIHALRSEILTSGPVVRPITPEGPHVPPELATCVQATNEALDMWEARTPSPRTWLTLPWLLVECVMYVRLATATAQYPALSSAGFDMFGEAKGAAWSKCVVAAADLAASMAALEVQLATSATPPATSAPAGTHSALELATAEVVQWSLWGNKTDLSLLVDASAVDPVGSSARGAAAGGAVDVSTAGAARVLNPHVIVDDFQQVWQHLAAAGGKGTVDLVLDNSGLELYGDLLLADFLITQKLASKVVLHGKLFPWFVSDTLAHDLTWLLEQVSPTSPTPQALVTAHGGDAAAAHDAWERVRRLGGRWAGHLASGQWEYRNHPFWTTALPICWMARASPDLHAQLQASQLVVYKGDLNYRKLVHDCRWPATTPFSTALQGAFAPSPGVLALRTLKADVVSGLQPGQAESLTAQDPQWLVNGKWGMVQFLPKGAG